MGAREKNNSNGSKVSDTAFSQGTLRFRAPQGQAGSAANPAAGPPGYRLAQLVNLAPPQGTAPRSPGRPEGLTPYPLSRAHHPGGGQGGPERRRGPVDAGGTPAPTHQRSLTSELSLTSGLRSAALHFRQEPPSNLRATHFRALTEGGTPTGNEPRAESLGEKGSGSQSDRPAADSTPRPESTPLRENPREPRGHRERAPPRRRERPEEGVPTGRATPRGRLELEPETPRQTQTNETKKPGPVEPIPTLSDSSPPPAKTRDPLPSSRFRLIATLWPLEGRSY
ncbi:basic salivary proline-rich protein 4-like [Echinops telfairi]|uniref:Basic salivary proline-rich protein 4-like n=1 Tax=Echinops telfairi TaxID=9371 RepID=A0ABM1VMI7_ECHTE|nr:basic salivary proline-rich protein 4-like [Echinops telfairi]